MRKGILIGAIMGFLTGLALQSYGPWTTGMVALTPEGVHLLAFSFVTILFVAASCGIIGAFLGEILEEGFLLLRH